jgi:hypothetical protein
MKVHWCEKEFAYNGEQLKSLFGYLEFGVEGDSVVAWTGPCNIPFEHMVDGEDLRQKAQICGAQMVHFIIEKFGISLYGAVAIQRLFATIAADVVHELATAKAVAAQLRREGDDLYVGDRKLSISIAAPSFNSCLVHFAVNAINEGTPVSTISLAEFGIAPVAFGKLLMDRFAAEEKSIVFATQKVKGVLNYQPT